MAIPATLGEFQIEGILGEGGSGIVYDATWGPRRVALKVLHVGRTDQTQFLGEAKRLAAIAHPAVVKVLAVGELADGRPYLAMERLDGETLASVIARGPMSLGLALELFAELCGAVGALHAQGLVHRDVKPENVFVVSARHAVLLDFGIAKELAAPASTTTQDGGVRGTPAYMAPERFFGQPAGVATDVYELAVTLYAMLAGRLPWDEASDAEARLSPRPLAGVPSELDVELRRAMSTRAQNRPASASELLEVVRTAAGRDAPAPADTARMGQASGDVTTDRLAPKPQHTTRAAPSRTLWPYALGLAVVAVATVFAAWKLRDRKDSVVVAPVTKPIARDPWGESAVPDAGPAAIAPSSAVKPLELNQDEGTAAEYRAEAAKVIELLPADTRAIVSVQLGELRAKDQIAQMIHKAAADPRLALLGSMLSPCVNELLARSEWVVYGAPKLSDWDHATVIIRGRWDSDAVVACFGAAATAEEFPLTELGIARSGKHAIWRIKELGYLDWVDTHTAYLSTRTDLGAAKINALALGAFARKFGPDMRPAKRMRDRVAALAPDRTVAIVVDGKSGDDWSVLDLPKGTDLDGWVRIEPTGLAFDLATDAHDERAATAAEQAMRPQLDGIFTASTADGLGHIALVRKKGLLRVSGTLTDLMLNMIATQ